MYTRHPFTLMGRLAPRGAAIAAMLLSLSACTTTGTANPSDGIGFREARFEEISAMQRYRQCRDDAVSLDEQARSSGNAGRYLASARLLEKCEAELGSEAKGLAVEERMRAYALGVQNYLKGGDVAKASETFQKFPQAFPGRDLYYFDGSSFIETMAVLFGQKEQPEYGRFAVLNVNETLKGEMRRVEYWKRN